MDQLVQVVVAVITTLGTIAVAYVGARSGRLGGKGKLEEAAAARERIELEQAKAEVWKEKFEAEVLAHAETTERAEFAERTADACERRLNGLYAELGRGGQLADRRSLPRQGDRREEGAR